MAHYYPEDQSQENLKKVRHNNVCAICGRQVAVYLDVKTKRKYIACSGQVHEGIVRVYKPPVEDYQSKLRRAYELEKEVMIPTETNALIAQGIPMTGLITKDQATIILKTVWKDAPEIEVYKAAMLCQDFGLHPLMKHVYLVKYDRYSGKGNERRKVGEDWVTILGIGATRLIMSRLGSFGYTDDTPRMMSEEEQLKIFGKVDNENIVAITKLRTKDGLEANGYGKYPKAGGYLIGEDKGNTRENMAFIRSERNGFGRLFPDANMPKPDVEVVDEQYLETPSGLVKAATGEIQEEVVEGEVKELPDDAPPVVQDEKPEEEPPTSNINLDWLKESLETLQKSGSKAYSEESMLGYMRMTFKGIEGDTIIEIAGKLDKGGAKHLADVIQDALNKL